MAASPVKRDREITRKIHQLLWRGSRSDLPAFTVWLCTKPLATVLYSVIIPFQIAYALQAIINRNFDAVYQHIYAIFLLAIAYCALWWIGGVAIARNVKAGTDYVQREVLANFLGKDYEYYVSAYVGSLGSQATRLRSAFNNYSTLLNSAFSSTITVVVASVAIIAWQSWILAIVTVAAMGTLFGFTVLSMRWRLKYRQVLSEAQDEAAGILGDVLGHAATVKSFAAEKYERKRLDRSFTKLSTVQYRSWVASVPPDVGQQFLSAGSILILLLLTMHLYQDNSISVPIVLLIQLYVVRLITATSQIADLMKTYDDIMANVYSAAKTMLVPQIVLDKKTTHAVPKSAKCDVVLENVSYRYQSSEPDTYAIKDLNLHINEGESIGLVGYSGSGKTTLTKLLLRFMDVTQGSITIGGVDIRDLAQEDLRRYIAYVPQEPLLFHRSIAENIGYGDPTASDDAISRAGRAAYVDEFLDDLPSGYDTLVGEKGVRLSGGQRQRVAIARAIVKNAPILVFDEATSALDSQSERYIQQALWELMKDRTTVVIAHRLSTIQHMDRIVVMDKGRIAEIGTHSELLSHPDNNYAKLWEHQRTTAGDTRNDSLDTESVDVMG